MAHGAFPSITRSAMHVNINATAAERVPNAGFGSNSRSLPSGAASPAAYSAP
eukprot:CAMPEP_0198691658 /NCGR_PEP_ID=MMETSP1468-20131203/209508_1 /TAXON_ID=1461545 /ORGANISM="Mantoniella sp, Strain CCMP1436" /LENGTH=51 /DNA_ID=CAMNT_0044445051 /DNA_START=43 /DNA_END=198 /DNA_ORIENTATION=+